MNVSVQTEKTALRTELGYIEQDPEKDIVKLMDWVGRLEDDGSNRFPAQRAAFRSVLDDPDNKMSRPVMDVFRGVDSGVVGTALENGFFNAGIIGWPGQEAHGERPGCSIPWATPADSATSWAENREPTAGTIWSCCGCAGRGGERT